MLLLISALVATVSSDHTGHDHSLLKPTGPFYGIVTQKNKAGTKTWNAMELSILFKDKTFDMTWWYGAKAGLVDIDKQVFECKDVPFTFDDVKLHVVIEPEQNDCLKKINKLFPKGWGLPNPYSIRVDHDTGDLKFSVARNLVVINLWAVDAPPAKIPSGEEGLAPATVPGRRTNNSNGSGDKKSAIPDVGIPADDAKKGQAVGVPPVEAAGETDNNGKSATARVGSVLVSTAAIIIAGLFL